MSYIPLTIQVMDPDTEEWSDHLHLHASQVNKAPATESFGAGADQYHPRLTFTVPWCKALEDVAYSTQLHRIVYRGRTYNIKDYDDFMERYIEVKLVGEAYG
jgi:head-tail adaptor